jgi:hypothetical protein
MSDKPRRPWFQIHLSTAIVLMLVTAVFLGANLRAEKWFGAESNLGINNVVISSVYGWPYGVVCNSKALESGVSDDELNSIGKRLLGNRRNIDVIRESEAKWPVYRSWQGCDWWNAIFNIAIYFVVLASIAFGLEHAVTRISTKARAP